MTATPKVGAYICPKCRSDMVKIGYPYIECLACRWSEPLIDFPISYDCHRSLCLEYGQPDPGSYEPPEHSIEELHERLVALEEHIQSSSLEVNQHGGKPKPKLTGGVKL